MPLPALPALRPLAPIALLALVAPWLRLPLGASIALGFTVATCATVMASDSLARFTSATPPPARRTLVLLLALAVVLGIGGYVLSRHEGDLASVFSGLVGSAGVLLGAGLVGALVGRRVAHAGHLPAVAMASSAADIWSVHSPRGVTHALVTVTDEGLQRLFAVSAAVPPERGPAGMVGAGDVLFAGLYLAVARRHGLARGRMIAALGVGLALALGATFVLRQPVPALPFMGASVVALNPPAWRVPRSDRAATVLAAVMLLIVAAVIHTVRG